MPDKKIDAKIEGDVGDDVNIAGRDIHIHYEDDDRDEERGPKKTLEITNLVLGIIASVIAVVVTVLGFVLSNRQADRDNQVADATATELPPMETATPTAAPTLTPTETVTPSPEPEPVFVTNFVFEEGWDYFWVEEEFSYEPGVLPDETIEEFLTVSRIALGELETGDLAFNVRLTLKNTDTKPILLDIDERFFILEDDQGREAEMIYFCCAAKGESLAVGQTRTLQMVFPLLPGWEGKETSASAIFLRVRGLLPIIQATWQIYPLATAD